MPRAEARRDLMRFCLQVLVAMLWPAPLAAVECEVRWLGIWGKNEEADLRINESFSLLRFATHLPSWYPELNDERGRYLGPAPPILKWDPLPTPAPLRSLGAIDGRRVYFARYSPRTVAVVWDRGEWSFCPVLVLDADESLVVRVDDPHAFTWQGRDVLSVRINYEGNGVPQQSLFFGVVSGRFVHLRQEPFWKAAPGYESHHRGGGFCRDSLWWENLGWRKDGTAGGILRAKYRIEDRNLCIESVEILERASDGDGNLTPPCRREDEPADWP
jgi:hypothetical protein